MGVASRRWLRGPCLGRGSTAAVYLAASTSADRESFAVKSAELSRSATLQKEQKILSSLCSPHIVSCLGSDVTTEPDGRVLYNLFVEYVAGGDLFGVIKQQGGLDERSTRWYARGILNGLAYLHSRGVVHCDVKAQNILVGKDDMCVKLADFGCARRVDGGDDRATIGGTPLYMAPEVARGEEQGPEADIWALGCTMIEMATGCPPWRDVADPVAAIHRIAFSNEVPEFPCSLSDEARDFLGRCLNRDPRQRWSAEELQSHPFVSCGEELAAGFMTQSKRVSPRSTLDQVFWDSWPDDDDEEDKSEQHREDQQVEYAQERLRQLLAVGPSPSAAVNATWDESCWVTIRINGEEMGSTIEEDGPSTSDSQPAEPAADGINNGEGSASYNSDRAGVITPRSHHHHHPSNPSRHVLVAAATCSSTLLGDGLVLVEETPSLSNNFIMKHNETVYNDCDNYCNEAPLCSLLDLARCFPLVLRLLSLLP